MTIFQKIFGAVLQIEQNLIPVFVKTPGLEAIAAVIFVTEEEIASQFGVPLPGQTTTATATPVVTATATAAVPTTPAS